jgi:NADH dehydrogenase
MLSRNSTLALAWRGILGGVLVAELLIGGLVTYQSTLASADNLGDATVWPLLAYAPVVGAVVGIAVGSRQRGLASAASTGILIGLLAWLLFSLTLAPVLAGHLPTWSIAAAGTSYGALVRDLAHGGLTALTVQLLPSGPAPALRSSTYPERGVARIVIVGSGFGGVSAARRFEQLALRGARIDVTLIGESNFLLFTPMLAEVASGALEPGHISAPVRAAVAHTRFRNRTVVGVDVDSRRVQLSAEAGPDEWIPYDHLVLAVGSVPQFLGLPGVAEHALTLKDLNDATMLRDHVLGLLESADNVDHARRRHGLLTFVVAGGGFAGVEAIAELFDLVHGVLHFFPGIDMTEPKFILVHSRDHILPELSTELGDYSLERLKARGIEFRLGVRVSSATTEEVFLDDGERISTRTFVWAAGNRPSPLVENIGSAHARNGALVADATFRVAGLDRVWAIGDCAQIPDVDNDGTPFPPTAQHATRQGRAVADNVVKTLRGRPPEKFRFRMVGILVALGHRTAAAEIYGRRFSGLVAWLLWRAIYVAKLPGIEKRIRVVLDWLLDSVFPRDIVVVKPRSTSLTAARDEGRL